MAETELYLEKGDYLWSFIYTTLFLIYVVFMPSSCKYILLSFHVTYGLFLSIRLCRRFSVHKNYGKRYTALFMVANTLIWPFIPLIALVVKGVMYVKKVYMSIVR